MIRSIRSIVTVLAALTLASAALVAGAPAPPAAAAISSQCSGVANVGGEGLDCRVTVENFLNLATGAASSRVTTLACSGAANVDPLPTCVGPTVTEYPELTTAANQCNGSANGGGSSLLCSITVVNSITGTATTSTAPINQCNGSLTTGDVRACTPDPATTDASADGVTQCNGSVNGGGGSMTCTVAPGSTSNSAFAFLANQCNDSANGGGARIVCTVDISTVVLPAAPVDEGPGDEGAGDDSPLRVEALPNTGASTAPLAALAALLLTAGIAAVLGARRAEVRVLR